MHGGRTHGGGAVLTVVYVEDNATNTLLMERIVARRPGVRLLTIGTGRPAAALVRGVEPDLVLLDLDLPDVSGEEVLRELRADERTRDVPVLVVSADATHSTRKRVLELGASDFLTKPLVVPRVLELLDTAINAKLAG